MLLTVGGLTKCRLRTKVGCMELTEEQVGLAEALAAWMNYELEAIMGDYAPGTLTKVAEGRRVAYEALEATGVDPQEVIWWSAATDTYYVKN